MFKLFRRFMGVKYYSEDNTTIIGVDDDKMQPSLVIAFIPFAIDLDVIYQDFCLISGIVACRVYGNYKNMVIFIRIPHGILIFDAFKLQICDIIWMTRALILDCIG